MEAVQQYKADTITKEDIEEYLFTSETKLSDKQKKMFIKLAQLHNLNPFKREIYAIPFGTEFSIVTGYQTYIERAEATGKLDGWSCSVIRDGDKIVGAKIIIHRKDFKCPFEWEVTFADFGKTYSAWKKMPEFMIKKVAIGQGFRLAFPNELGNMPYLQEEMEGAKKLEEASDQEALNKYKVIVSEFKDFTEYQKVARELINDAVKNGVLLKDAELIARSKVVDLKAVKNEST